MKQTSSLLEIQHCLYDIMDERRIDSQLNGYEIDGIETDNCVIYKCISLSDFIKVEQLKSLLEKERFTTFNNIIVTNISYLPSKISDDEVCDILEECESKLKTINCKLRYFIGWGDREDIVRSGSSDVEWRNFKKMIKKTVYGRGMRRTINIKIVKRHSLRTRLKYLLPYLYAFYFYKIALRSA
jgi:hypothetical protein